MLSCVVDCAEFQALLFGGCFEGGDVGDGEDELHGGSALLAYGCLMQGDVAAAGWAGQLQPAWSCAGLWDEAEMALVEGGDFGDISHVEDDAGDGRRDFAG